MAIGNIRTPSVDVASSLKEDPYQRIAHLYYWEYKTLTADLDLYLALLRNSTGDILEIGCGTGRIATALAEEGYSVTGIDSSEEMLKYARKMKRELTERKELRLDFVRADMRTFSFARRFSTVLIPFSTFAFLTSLDDQDRTLRTIHEHLNPGGRLVIDLFAPDFSKWGIERGEKRYVSSFFCGLDEGGVELVNKFEKIDRDPYSAMLDIHYIYEIHVPRQENYTITTSITLSMFTRKEILLLLEKNGFVVEDIYGDYKMKPYSRESPRLIFVAEKHE